MPVITPQRPPVDEPKYPVAQLTTYVLNAYLRRLEAVVTFFRIPTVARQGMLAISISRSEELPPCRPPTR